MCHTEMNAPYMTAASLRWIEVEKAVFVAKGVKPYLYERASIIHDEKKGHSALAACVRI